MFPAETPRGSSLGVSDFFNLFRVLMSQGPLTRGKSVEIFEERLRQVVGLPFALSVSSCSIAIRLAWQALGLKPFDEVIVPVNAFWNSVSYLYEAGISVKIADVEGYSLMVDIDQVESLISPRTRAILSYSHGGFPSPLPRLRQIADKNGVFIVEDSAHALGATVRDEPLAHLADIACFSFSTLKNIGTLGEGGAIATRHENLFLRLKALAATTPIGRYNKVNRTYKTNLTPDLFDHFLKPTDAVWREWLEIEQIGLKSTMTTAQAAVGVTQLEKLSKFTNQRALIAATYDRLVAKSPDLSIQPKCLYGTRVYHLYCFFVHELSLRTQLYKAMLAESVVLPPNRFWPLNLNSVALTRGSKSGQCPIYEQIWFYEMVSLPISPVIRRRQPKKIRRAFCELFGEP